MTGGSKNSIRLSGSLLTLLTEEALTGDEATALLTSVVADYSYALDLLDDYDHGGVQR